MTDLPDDAGVGRVDHVTDVVELAVPARSAYVSVLRSTTAALAARLDFTLDEIEDLRIAVDEASALLLAQALPTAQISCRFGLYGHELTVAVSVRSREPRVPTRNSFAWTVLSALAGQVDARIEPDEGRVTISLTKHGEAAHPTSESRSDVRQLKESSSLDSGAADR